MLITLLTNPFDCVPFALMSSQRSSAIRERLISAAGPVFARHGYDAATVTQICTAAEANVAAINYHFGDKRALYREVLKTAIQRMKGDQREPADRERNVRPTEARIALISVNILRGVLAMDDKNWPLTLVLREFLHPTAEFGSLIRAELDLLAPSNYLYQTVAAITGFAADDPRLQWSIFCVLAPSLLLGSKPKEMARHFPALETDKLDLDAFAAHIGRILTNGLAPAGPTPASKVRGTVPSGRRR